MPSSGDPHRTDSPVIIIGTERSGSNLLRLMLDLHPNIAVPHPPHFMRYLAPLASTYGDLTDEANRRRLVRDALALLRAHIHPWECKIDEDLAVRESRPTVFGVTAALYEQYRRAAGKPRWGCKSTFMVDHVDGVLAEYPGARLIWLVRDPLDVAASMRQSVFGPCQPRLSAELWHRQQRKALVAVRRWGTATIRMVRYEDLVTSPRPELGGVMRHLGEEFDPAMLAHHETAATSRLSRMCESWQRTGQPVNADRIGSHWDELTAKERRQVLAVTGELRSELGYERLAVPPGRPTPHLLARLQDVGLRAAIEYRSFRHDLNWQQRWRRDAVVRWIELRAACRSAGRTIRERALPDDRTVPGGGDQGCRGRSLRRPGSQLQHLEFLVHRPRPRRGGP
jgi:Sulfotransferase family